MGFRPALRAPRSCPQWASGSAHGWWVASHPVGSPLACPASRAGFCGKVLKVEAG